MNKTTIPILILILLPLCVGYGQRNNSTYSLDSTNRAILDTALSIQKRVNDILFDGKVSIYEFGDSLVGCETNFENLYRNWNNRNITNANQYSFDNYSFVETISDSTRYRYYLNYFSGLEIVMNYVTKSCFASYDGKQTRSGNEYFIAPFKYKWILLEQLPTEIFVEILKLYNTEIDMDTINLKTVSQESTQIFEEIQDGDSSYHNYNRIKTVGIWAYSDSITKQCIDSMVLHQVPIEDLSIKSRIAIETEEVLLMRSGMQKIFKEAVNIGDKVYVVPFRFGNYQFEIFVICNPITKKVVLDYFFKSILY